MTNARGRGPSIGHWCLVISAWSFGLRHSTFDRLVPLVRLRRWLVLGCGGNAGDLLHQPYVEIAEHLGRQLVAARILPERHRHAGGMKQGEFLTDAPDGVNLRIATVHDQET